MGNAFELIINLTKAEYDGPSFNGPNLVKTLKVLTMEQVLSTETYEKYTAWGVVLHLMYWKYKLAQFLGAQEVVAFPYQEDNFPALPEDQSAASWQKTLDDLDTYHKAYIKALEAFPEEKLAEKLEEWGCSFGQAIAWMTTHDTYHIAQIRNMGLDLHFEPS